MGQSPGTAGLCTPEYVLYIVFWYLMRYQIPGLDPPSNTVPLGTPA